MMDVIGGALLLAIIVCVCGTILVGQHLSHQHAERMKQLDLQTRELEVAHIAGEWDVIACPEEECTGGMKPNGHACFRCAGQGSILRKRVTDGPG